MNFIKAKVYKLFGPRELVIVEEEIDIDNLDENQFFAKTVFSAISPGTETAAFEGVEALRPGKIYPRVVGYCNIAEVLMVGKKIDSLNIGDYVLTFQSHRSHFVQNKNDFYLKVDDSIAKDSSIAYLFHLGYHSLLTAEAKQGHNIGIIGAGVLGIATSIMSQISGARTFVFSNQIEVSDFLHKTGMNIKCYPKDQHSSLNVENETENTGLDILVNTSNAWSDWKFAIKIISNNGIIVNLGFPGRGDGLPTFNPLDPQYLYTKNLTVKSLCPLYEIDILPSHIRFNLKRNLEYIISLLKTKKILKSHLVSEEINYDELKSQYLKYLSKKKFLLSTIVNWNN